MKNTACELLRGFYSGGGGLVQLLKLSACKVGDCGFEQDSGLQVPRNKMFLSRSLVIYSILREPL